MSVEQAFIELSKAIDTQWEACYGDATPSGSLKASLIRVKLLGEDVRCQHSNFKTTNKSYVEADRKVKALTAELGFMLGL